MTSARTGWALRWTQNPAVADDGYLAPARTTDGAHTWTSVTPPAAHTLLATPDARVVLQALDGQRAWLAVTAATTDSPLVHLTEVFTTVNGGRAWTESAPLKVPGYASFLSAARPERGWLLMAYGGAMGQEPVQLYRCRQVPGRTRGSSSSARSAACSSPPARRESSGTCSTPRQTAAGPGRRCRRGRSFTQLGTSFDFVSVRTGFAWAPGADAKGSSPPAMYLTTDSGRTWESFTPRPTRAHAGAVPRRALRHSSPLLPACSAFGRA